MRNDLGKPESAANPTADETTPAAPEPTAPASEPTTTTPPAEPVSEPKVADVDDYQRRLEAALAPAPEPKPQGEPAAEPEEPSATDEPPAEPAPGEETQPPTETDPPTEPEAAEPEPPAEPPKKDFRPRLNNLPEVEQEAIALRKQLKEQGQDVSLKECLSRVEAKYQTPAAADEPQMRTIEQVEADITAKKAEKREAAKNLDTDKMLDIDDEIDALRKEVTQIERHQASQAEVQQNAFEREVAASRAQVTELYPIANQAGHAIHAKAEEIAARLDRTGNPLLAQSDAPLRIYQMAANELGIAPIDPAHPPEPAATPAAPPKSSAPATPKPQAVVQRAVGRPNPATPAPASARTTQPGPPTILSQPVRTRHDYEAKLEKLGIKAA